MDARRLVPVLLIVGVLAAGGAALAVGLGVDVLDVSVPDASDSTPESSDRAGAAVTSFSSTGGVCVAEPSAGRKIVSGSTAGRTSLVVKQNVTLPATNYVLDAATIRRTGPTNYSLDVETRAVTEKPASACDGAAQARYTVRLEVPHGKREPFTVVVRHDGEVVTRIDQTKHGSGAGGYAGGEAVDDGDSPAGNRTTSA